MQVDITAEEQQALLGWKKRSDSLILIRLKAEAMAGFKRNRIPVRSWVEFSAGAV
ncbi:hypothetical protein NSA19_11995 [Actinomyces bowdenii]|uniref:hypothetical protein n=1 Tax=Actinomyces bowdenii TaxID=131109 RepID=UPI00214CEA54|nr:hypothetical protein [Actinomyces bowdenii]MCR2053545.1 hypothetical protein [Actinomyces bowdenii]